MCVVWNAAFLSLRISSYFVGDTAPITTAMDVEYPGGELGPSTSTAAAPSHPNDTDSKDTMIFSATSDETTDDSDFVPAAKHKAKRRQNKQKQREDSSSTCCEHFLQRYSTGIF